MVAGIVGQPDGPVLDRAGKAHRAAGQRRERGAALWRNIDHRQVGEAGQLLTKIIAAMKLRRDDVFICNVLKCRPPQNRNPLPDEIENCEPYLIRQLEIIKPKVICALGKFAAQTLLRTERSISSLRGNFFDYHGIKLMPTYHPA